MTIVQSTFSGPRPPGAGRLALTLEDPVKGYRFWIDLEYGGVSNRYFYGKIEGPEQDELDTLIDLVAESTWFRPE